MKKILMLTAIISLVLSGCASVENYEKICNSWLGENINHLTQKWGYPKGELIAPNGNKVYVYHYSRNVNMPVMTNVYGTYNGFNAMSYGGNSMTFYCTTYFEVDQSGTIVNWRIEGNDCVG